MRVHFLNFSLTLYHIYTFTAIYFYEDLVHNNAAKPTPKGTDFTAHSDKKYHAIEYPRQNIIYFDFSIDIQ